MADPYVIFPGTAGNYLSTPDVNLLDADTAHTYQSVGTWAGITAAAVALTTTGDSFSGSALQVTSTANGAHIVDTGIIPAANGDTRAATLTVELSTPQTVRLDMIWSDAGVVIQTSTDDEVALPAGITVLEWAGTAATAGIDGVQLRIRFDRGGVTTSGETSKVYDCGLRAGSDAGFVPSLRIVGDLDLRYRAAPVGWANDGYRNSYVQRGAEYGVYDAGTTGGQWRFQYVSDTVATTILSGDLSAYVTGGVAAEITVRTDWSVPEVSFYIDGVLRSTQPILGTRFAATAAADLNVGGLGTLYLTGDYYSAQVRDGVDGPVVAEFLASDIPVAAQLPA